MDSDPFPYLDKKSGEFKQILAYHEIANSPCFLTSLAVAIANTPKNELTPTEIFDRLCEKFIEYNPEHISNMTSGLLTQQEQIFTNDGATRADIFYTSRTLGLQIFNRIMQEANLQVEIDYDDLPKRVSEMPDKESFLKMIKQYFKELQTKGISVLLPMLHTENNEEVTPHMTTILGTMGPNDHPILYDQLVAKLVIMTDDLLFRLFSEGVQLVNDSGLAAKATVQELPVFLIIPKSRS